jgi:MFS family permease
LVEVRATSTRRRGGLGKGRNVVASIAASAFGTWGYNVGIAVYAYETTHSAGWVAAVTVGRYVPAIVLSWLAAGLVDRLPRRGLVVASDLACAAIMLALGALAAADSPLWLLIVVAAMSSTTARVQASAVLSLAADIVVESQLGRASSMAAAAEAVAAAAGSAAASIILVSFDPSVLFFLNAGTFVVSALLIGRVPSVPVRRAAAASARANTPAPPVLSGRLWPLQASRTLAAYVYGTDIVLLTVVASEQLGSGTFGYGWLLAAAGVGGLLVVMPRVQFDAGSTARSATIGVALYALPLLVFVADPSFAAGIGTQIVRGAGCVLVTSSVIAALQRATPSAVAGRVFGQTQSLVLVGICLGAVATPVLLELVGFDATIVLAALIPCAGQLLLHPLLVRFGREEAVMLAALDPRLSTLRQLDLLRAASRSTLYELAGGIVDVKAAPGEVIIAEGGTSAALYVLASGRVEVTQDAPGGPVVLRQMQSPDHFGEIGLLGGTPRTATVTAVDQCELWRIPAETFLLAVSHAGVSGVLAETTRIRRDYVPPTPSDLSLPSAS